MFALESRELRRSHGVRRQRRRRCTASGWATTRARPPPAWSVGGSIFWMIFTAPPNTGVGSRVASRAAPSWRPQVGFGRDTSPSIRPRQTQDMLGQIAQHQIVRDWGYSVEPRLAELSLDVAFGVE